MVHDLPGSDRPEGVDPDYRFSLANERTFLSWVRTALALIVAGLALTQLPEISDDTWRRVLIGVPPVVAAIWLAAHALRDWSRAEDAMRHGQPIPLGTRPRLPIVAILIAWAVVGTIAAVVR